MTGVYSCSVLFTAATIKIVHEHKSNCECGATIYSNMWHATVAVVRGFCPDGWHHYNGSCFYVSTANASQPEARSKCLTMNADLASISNQAEWDFVKSIS